MFKLSTLLFILLAGILYALGFPTKWTTSFLITPIIAFCILFIQLFNHKELNKKILLALLFGVAFNYSGFYWITKTLQVFGELPLVVAALIASLFSVVIMLYLWPMVGIIHWLQKKGITQFSAIHIVVLSLLFTFLEYFTPEQFPTWIGQPWVVFGENLGLARFVGVPGFSFISFLIIFMVINYYFSAKKHPVLMGMVGLFIILNPLLKLTPGKVDKEFNVRVVQANIGNYLKIESESGDEIAVESVLSSYEELSLAPSNVPIDLIVWPETAYPYSMISKDMKKNNMEVPEIITRIIHKSQSEFLTGGYDERMEEEESYQSEYNSSFHFQDDGLLKKVYHKHILIPFGETLPFGPLTPYFSKFITSVSYFSQGTDYTIFEAQNGTRFFTPICYEILKPEFLRVFLNKNRKRPHLMINLTNDSWYGDTAEPLQHLFLAKWRSLEFNLPFIRATNTGITSYIDVNASESTRLGVGEKKILDLNLALSDSKPTYFQLYGFMNTVVLALIFLVAAWIEKRLVKSL